MAAKRCARCGHEKPLADFHQQTRSPDGHGGYCKPCQADYQRAWRKANREHVRAYHRLRSRRLAEWARRYAEIVGAR